MQAEAGDPGGKLRLGDQLWAVPWDLDLDRVGSRIVALAQLVRAGGRVGIASESADKGGLVQKALMLVLHEAQGWG